MQNGHYQCKLCFSWYDLSKCVLHYSWIKFISLSKSQELTLTYQLFWEWNTDTFWQAAQSCERPEWLTEPGMTMHSLEPNLTDAPISHYACNAPSGTTDLLQKPLVFGTDRTAQSLYLQMKLLYDAGDQPGELVHINRIDKSHGFFYAVWEKKCPHR